MTRDRRPVVGIYHASPEPYLPLLRERVPEERLRFCREWDGIESILDDVEILLAFKFGTRPFPREAVLNAPRLKWVQLAGAGAGGGGGDGEGGAATGAASGNKSKRSPALTLCFERSSNSIVS